MTKEELFDWVKGAAEFFGAEELPEDSTIFMIVDAGSQPTGGIMLGKNKNLIRAMVKLMLGAPRILQDIKAAVNIAERGKEDGWDKMVEMEIRNVNQHNNKQKRSEQ